MIEWKLTKEELPELDHFCLLYDSRLKWIWMGCRTHFDDTERWLWSDSCGDFWWSEKEKKYNGTEEISDYQPSHWIYLPEPPQDKENQDPNYIRHVKERRGDFTF